MTIKDVAKKSGVSVATVSRVLNNPQKVSFEKRKKVQKAIQDLGFKPDFSARKLAGGRTNTIGLIIPGYEGIFTSFYALEIIKYLGIEIEFLKKDLYIHIFRGRDIFDIGKVDAVIFADMTGNQEQVKRIVNSGLFCVVLNNPAKDIKVNSVSIDNKKAAREVVNYLYGLGHRRIGHIAGDLRACCAQDRLKGFKDALKGLGLSLPSGFVQIGNFSRVLARKCAEKMLNLKNPPTAIFCASDDMADEVLRLAIEKGINVPKDLSLVGFDDNPEYLYAPVSITTVYQPLKNMVLEAVKILKNYFADRPRKVVKKILPAEIIVKDSTYYSPV